MSVQIETPKTGPKKATVICSACKATSTRNVPSVDPKAAVMAFKFDGWSFAGKHAKCPSCAKRAPQQSTRATPAIPYDEGAEDSVAEILEVSPLTALEWLEKNPHNRAVNWRHVKQLAMAMTAGMWQLNGETIKLDIEGNILDGQHRLQAVVMADIAILTYVIRDLPPTTFDTIDVGRKRSSGDMLSISGERNYNNLASGLRMVVKMRENAMRSNEFLFDVITELDNYPNIRRFAHKNTDIRRLFASMGLYTACRYLLWRCAPAASEEFFDGLLLGVNLSPQSPVLHLRERLMAGRNAKQRKDTPEDTLGLIFNSWNHFLAGDKVSKAQRPKDPPRAIERFVSSNRKAFAPEGASPDEG